MMLLTRVLGYILPILALVAFAYEAVTLAWIFAAAALAVIVGNAAYDAGYKTGQRDLVDPPHQRPLTGDQRNRMLMRTTLPPWRRWLGVAAIVVPNLFFLPYVFVMTRYGGSGWLVLLYIVLYLVYSAWASGQWSGCGDPTERRTGKPGEHVSVKRAS
jgi:hypothetical protein